MLFEVHYSKNGLRGKDIENERIREMLRDVWKFEKVEASSEQEAIGKVINNIGEENINYVMSVSLVD